MGLFCLLKYFYTIISMNTGPLGHKKNALVKVTNASYITKL